MARRTPVLALLVAVAATLLPVVTAGSAAAATPAQVINARIEQALRGSTARSTATHVVVDGIGTVHARNATAGLPPASTEKNFVALAALERLGAGTRFVTEVRATAQPDARGVIAGDVVFVASGDPTLRGTHLANLASQLRNAGVRHITGTLYGDDLKYDRARRAPGWKWSWVPGEVGSLSAFVLDRNVWRRDAGFLANPAGYNLGRFRQALWGVGISVNGGPTLGEPPAPASEVLATYASPTVAAIVRSMLKSSDNLYAEILLKELAAQDGLGTTAGGAAVLRQQASRYGIRLVTVADGSGLSSYNRQSPLAHTMWLKAGHPNVQFRQALPVACKDGTLKRRFCGTAAAGRVWAKTGTLSGVRTLAGYTMTRNGKLVRFAFQLSGASSGSAATAAIDRAVIAIASSYA